MEMELMTRSEQRSTSGFSLIEVMVASAILLVIALGLVPLYMRSIRSNVEGFDYTQVANSARSRADEFFQLPFNSPAVEVPAGQEELEVQDFYSHAEHRWMEQAEWDLVEGEDVALFTRTTTVRQFSIGDLKTPLVGGEAPEAVHLKEITVSVEGSRTAVLGGGKVIAVRLFKSQ